jgi:predicted nucleotidyltransferase
MKIESSFLAGWVWISLLSTCCWAAPSVTTQPATDILANGATLEASVNPNGTTTSLYFQYGPTIGYGSLTSTSSITAGAGAQIISNAVTGLLAGTSYHYRAIAFNASGTAQGGDLIFTPPVFTLTNCGLPAIASSSVAWADFNNDGRLDILLAGANASFSPISQVWQNQGAYSFGAVSGSLSELPAVTSGAVAWGDFDNTGSPGFLLTGYGGLGANNLPVLISQVWRNQGNGTFTNIDANLPGVDTGSVAWGDFDGDGDLDILLTGNSSTGAVTQVWRNLGNDTFTNINAGLPGVFYSSVAVADFENDGKLDILLTGTTNGFSSGAITEIWRNLGNGVFTNINLGLPAIFKGSVAVGDFNNDGRVDILLTGYASTGAVAQVWLNLGNGAFTNVNAGLPGVAEGSVAVGDYDNDSNLDILVSGVDSQTNPVTQVWHNLGNGVFTNANAGLPGVQSGSVAWADFNNDGRLDILLTGYDTNNHPLTAIYHNNSPLGNSIRPRLTNIFNSSRRAFQFSFRGKTGEPYQIWTSTNAIQWNLFGAPYESSAGTFQVYDQAAATYRSRMYRATSP